MGNIKVGEIYLCAFFDKRYVVTSIDGNVISIIWLDTTPDSARSTFSAFAMTKDIFIGMSTDLLLALI